jgi:hypothetical protein
MRIYPCHAWRTSPISDRSGYHANEARRKVPPWLCPIDCGPSYCMCTVENELLQQRLFFLVFFLYPFKINLSNTFSNMALPFQSHPRWWRLGSQSLHKHAGRASSILICLEVHVDPGRFACLLQDVTLLTWTSIRFLVVVKMYVSDFPTALYIVIRR